MESLCIRLISRCCFSRSWRDGENRRWGDVALPRVTSRRSPATGLGLVATPPVIGDLPGQSPQEKYAAVRSAVPHGLCAPGPVNVPPESPVLPSAVPLTPHPPPGARAVRAKLGGPLEEEAVVVEGSFSKLGLPPRREDPPPTRAATRRSTRGS